MWRARENHYKVPCPIAYRRGTPFLPWNQGSSWLCPADTPQASWEDFTTCIWGDHRYTDQTSNKTLHIAYTLSRTKTWVGGHGILPNKYWYQESCVKGTASMPAVKVAPGKSPTKNRTVAKTPVSLPLPPLQVNTRQWQRVTWGGEQLHTNTTLWSTPGKSHGHNSSWKGMLTPSHLWTLHTKPPSIS